MNAIVVNDLSVSKELDCKSLAEIVGGYCVITSGPWKYLGSTTVFKGWVSKGGKWYKRFLRTRKYKRCQIKKCYSYVCLPAFRI